MKITIEISKKEVGELKPLYEESNQIIKAAGREPWTFEHWCETMMSLGGTEHIKANAKTINRATKQKYFIEAE